MKPPRFAARFGPPALPCLLAAAFLCAGSTHISAQSATASGMSAIRYPATARSGQADDLGGSRIADPYRWLENLGLPEVRSWVGAQSSLTESFLASLPRRGEIHDRVARAWTHMTISAPFAAGDRLFFYENRGLENQPVLYVKERVDVVPRVLLDANAFSNDGLIAVVDQAASPKAATSHTPFRHRAPHGASFAFAT